jgi:2-amino-4-hydroxy-6-hydroxymethyldihydropteridine diphosphokinase
MNLFVLLGLGSNLDNRLHYLQSGVEYIKKLPNLVNLEASSVYETPPWGIVGTPAYLNAALLLTLDITRDIDTDINIDVDINLGRALQRLLEQLQVIETKLDRVRDIDNQFAARTLDIDILYAAYLASDQSVTPYSCNTLLDMRINMPALIVPHPRLSLRAFALKPALDVWKFEPGRKTMLAWLQTPQVLDDVEAVVLHIHDQLH